MVAHLTGPTTQIGDTTSHMDRTDEDRAAVTYKQPHEGIRGTLRDDDDLLSLDERALAVRNWLIGLASHLYSATLVGNRAPKVDEMYRRISAPRVGDVVVEMTAMLWSDDSRKEKGFGVLLAERDEWGSTDEEWGQYRSENPEGAESDGRWSDHAWYVQYGPQPEDVCRWTNCVFVVVPRPDEKFDEPMT